MEVGGRASSLEVRFPPFCWPGAVFFPFARQDVGKRPSWGELKPVSSRPILETGFPSAPRMPTFNIPHYIDVVAALEKAVTDMSRDAGLGLAVSNNRFLLPRQKRLEFSFQRLGDKKWSLRVAVEKVGGETASSAFRIILWLPDGTVKEETVHLANDEQLGDLGLRYAETITYVAAEPEPEPAAVASVPA